MYRRTLLAALLITAPAGAAAQQNAITMTRASRQAVVESLAVRLDSVYIFPELARDLGKQLRARARSGAYERYADPDSFAAALTDDLHTLGHDVHLGVDFSAEPLSADEEVADSVMEKRRLEWSRTHNYGLQRVEILPGNVGYLNLTGMYPLDRGGRVIAAAMEFLANTDALIIDLRENHGGSPVTVAFLVSYFIDGVVHLNDFVYRDPGARRQFYTSAYVPGRRYLDRPVYILTSRQTVSAGEEFAYDMQVNKRATLIGEVTAGGANPGGTVRLDNHFEAFIPTGRAVNPITGTNWEGVGVKPDVAVPAAEALEAAVRRVSK
ncbi:MAG: S41 family peptidase [Gemmatimonadales bacterium]